MLIKFASAVTTSVIETVIYFRGKELKVRLG